MRRDSAVLNCYIHCLLQVYIERKTIVLSRTTTIVCAEINRGKMQEKIAWAIRNTLKKYIYKRDQHVHTKAKDPRCQMK